MEFDKAEAEGVGELRRLLSQLRTHHKITLTIIRLVQLP